MTRLTESERRIMQRLLEIPIPILADAIARIAQKMKLAMDERRALRLTVH